MKNFDDNKKYHPQNDPNKLMPLPLFRELPPAEVFPIGALGKTLSAAHAAIQESIQAPDALIAQSLLAGAALAAQAIADIEIDGRRFPISLFFLTVGQSGERKSAVDRIALSPHRAFEKEKAGEFKGSLRAYEAEKEIYDLSKRRCLPKGNKNLSQNEIAAAFEKLGPAPIKPNMRMLIIEEPTYEGLAKAFIEGQASLGLFSDEGGRMVGGHGMSEENLLKTIAGLSELWDGKPISRTRASEGSTKAYGKRFSMHLLMQPVVFHKMTSNALMSEQGIMARCLPSFPESTVGKRPYKAKDISEDESIIAYQKKIEHLLKHSLQSPNIHYELEPKVLVVSESDKDYWIGFHDYVEQSMRENQSLSCIRGFASKIAEQVLRLSGVLTLIEDINATEITTEALNSATQLGHYYLSEALRLYETSQINPDLIKAKKLSEWCQKFDEIYPQKIYQYGPNDIREKAVALKIIEILEEHCHLRSIPEGKRIDGKHRKQAWEVVK